MKCVKCGDVVTMVAAVLACRTCKEDGTANECGEFVAVEDAVAHKPQLANRFRTDVHKVAAMEAVLDSTAAQRSQAEQDAVDEANRLVEQRRIFEAEEAAKANAAAGINPGGGEFGGAGASGNFGDEETKRTEQGETQSLLDAQTMGSTDAGPVEGVLGTPAAEAGQVDQGADVGSTDGGST